MSLPLPPVLVVDDERNMRLSLQDMLSADKYPVRTVESAEDAMALLERESFLLVITDVRLGGMNGMEFMRRALQRWPGLPFLMITAHATPRLAVEAIKAGATEYLPKPFAPEELLHNVALCADRYRLVQENAALRARTVESFSLERIIGSSSKMRELRQLIQTVAPSDATVLILGESGTGKELIAGALHSLSRRSEKNYVRINCAAIPETLLESELFGHEKGAFTDAHEARAGKFELAAGDDVLVVEPAAVERLAIELRALDVARAGRVAARDDAEGFARAIDGIDPDLDLVEQRREKFVARVAGARLMQARRSEDIPRRHLADVFIAA